MIREYTIDELKELLRKYTHSYEAAKAKHLNDTELMDSLRERVAFTESQLRDKIIDSFLNATE